MPVRAYCSCTFFDHAHCAVLRYCMYTVHICGVQNACMVTKHHTACTCSHREHPSTHLACTPCDVAAYLMRGITWTTSAACALLHMVHGDTHAWYSALTSPSPAKSGIHSQNIHQFMTTDAIPRASNTHTHRCTHYGKSGRIGRYVR